MNTKQVAEWMLELAEWFGEISKTTIMPCTQELNVNRSRMWKKRAAQVEAMTCDGCYHWDNSPWQVTPETRLCMFPEKRANAESWGFINDCGPEFGCIHWEAKND